VVLLPEQTDWANGGGQTAWTNIIVKTLVTALVFWTIYLVPEKPIYEERNDLE
jgi:hypothetical protein